MKNRFAIAAILALATPALAADVAPPPPGYVPGLKTTEAGLWRSVEQFERELAQSPLLIKDEKVNSYVRGIACKLSELQCSTLRIYVIENAAFNASVFPNGAVMVHSGLLVRLENEAQLAAILGHEITHYLKRHTLNRFESIRDTQNALAFFSLGVAGVGVGYGVNLSSVTDFATLIAAGSLFQYNRDQETESDSEGLKLSIAAGYDPQQAVTVWRDIESEQAANPNRKSAVGFTRTHPANLDRMKALAKLADRLPDGKPAQFVGVGEYRATFAEFRGKWLEAELSRAQYDESLHVLSRLISAEPSNALLRFYQGEAYRRRNAKGDLQNALASYRQAVDLQNAPSIAYRGLGLAALKSGDKPSARVAFARYLELVPNADDRAMVELYLSNAEQ